ncbi:MAG: type II toxin-antitoxin system PemK/MazF family toxin, partial [Lachnospiraceae bacterium]|nr:type II toxin-antitoxin system PemK/MazF family toxin [Lachnospiraceae bacterium]
TLDDTCNSYDEMVITLRKHFSNIDKHNSEQIKLANEYYKWTALKTRLISNENLFQIPSSALPNTIKISTFQWLRPEKQSVILKHYRLDKNTNQYIIAVKKDNVPNDDIEVIMRSLVLIRKTVVWVDFGYNIGTEFGGRHPAIILKNLKDSLVVIPLSSQEPKTIEYSVKVDKVYGFPPMPRWANVTRITQVSLSRVHFKTIGDVKPSILAEINNKLKSCGII